MLWLRSPGINIPQDWPSPGQYFDVVNENHSFEETSISQGRSGTLLGISGAGETPANQEAQRVEALLTSSSLFHMLGAKPFRGRLLRPDEDKPGQPAVAILSHGFWQRVFGGDPEIIGKTVTMNVGVGGTGQTKNQFEVVGILGPEFLLNEEIMPTVASIRQMDVFCRCRGARTLCNAAAGTTLIARLKPRHDGAGEADVAAIAGRIRDGQATDLHDRCGAARRVRRRQCETCRAILLGPSRSCPNACANRRICPTRDRPAEGSRSAHRHLAPAGRGSFGNSPRPAAQRRGAAGLLIAKAALQWSARSIRQYPRLRDISLDGPVPFTFAVSIAPGCCSAPAPRRACGPSTPR